MFPDTDSVSVSLTGVKKIDAGQLVIIFSKLTLINSVEEPK